jgi:hypothetical protein
VPPEQRLVNELLRLLQEVEDACNKDAERLDGITPSPEWPTTHPEITLEPWPTELTEGVELIYLGAADLVLLAATRCGMADLVEAARKAISAEERRRETEARATETLNAHVDALLKSDRAERKARELKRALGRASKEPRTATARPA